MNSLKLLSIAKIVFNNKNTAFRQISYSRAIFNDEWFKNLSESSNISDKTINNATKNEAQKPYSELTEEEKKERVLKFKRELDITEDQLPLSYIEKNWATFSKRSTYNEAKNSLKYFVKQFYYSKEKAILKEKKEKIKQMKIEKYEEKKIILKDTNIPLSNKLIPQITNTREKDYYRTNYGYKVVNDKDLPQIVFDFRYVNNVNKLETIVSMETQFNDIVSSNQTSKNPFILNYCNYNKNSEFHKKYQSIAALDTNLVFETDKNYMDIFPREKLIYLSRDAKPRMEKFDPNKIYIIGSIIDDSRKTFKYASLSQAKQDGIPCESLPIDKYVKWIQSTKDLAMNHVFRVLLSLHQGNSMKRALEMSLPPRKFQILENEKTVENKKYYSFNDLAKKNVIF